MIDWIADHFDYYPGDCDDDEWMDGAEDEDPWECEFGAHCLMPSFLHRRSECYNLEMALAWQEEMNDQT
jgi:hypothetical protein